MAKWLVAFTMAIGFSFAANAAPEEEALSAFEFICLGNLNDFDRVPKYMEDMGVPEIPTSKAVTFLAPQTGRAWLRIRKEIRFAVTITDTGACSLTAPNIDGRAALALFKKFIKNRSMRTEDIGTQIQEFFAVTAPDNSGGAVGHALVMTTTSRFDGGKGIIFNAIPEVILRRGGIPIPAWP